MIYAIKKQNESNERLISRFKKLVQRSRIIIESKNRKTHKHKPKKGHIRQAAILRAGFRKEREMNQFAS